MKTIFILTILLTLFIGCGDSNAQSTNKFDCTTCDNWERCNDTATSCMLAIDKCYNDQNCLGRDDDKLTCGGDDGHSCIKRTQTFDCDSCTGNQVCNAAQDGCETFDCNSCTGNQVCNVAQNGCETFDCDSCTGNQVCNVAQNGCETFDCDSCTGNQVCNVAQNGCIDQVDPCDNIVCDNTWKICEAGQCVLKEGHCDDKSDCSGDDICQDYLCTELENNFTSIASIQQDQVEIGLNVRIKGIITAISDQSIWVQEKGDQYAGLLIYSVASYLSDLTTGDEVEIQGDYVDYYTLAELKDVTEIKKTGNTEALPNAISLTATDFQTASIMEPFEGMIVTFSDDFTVTEMNNSNIILTNKSGQNIILRNTIYDNISLTEGDKIEKVTGILSAYKDEFQILPRFEADLTYGIVLSCQTTSCDPKEICIEENYTPVCICDTANNYFDDGNGGCKNSCTDYSDPCTDLHKTTCVPTGGAINDHTCLCDSGYKADENGDCQENSTDCFDFRAMAANTTSGNCSSYIDNDCSADPNGQGIRIFQGLKPDIVMIQEFNVNDNSDEDIRSFIDEAFGEDFYYSRGSVGSKPNGIISRWPITDYGYWDQPEITDRALDWAIVDLPGDKDLFVISVHLKTSSSSRQITSSLVVANEVQQIKEAQPNQYYFMVGGDMNGSSAVSSDGFGKYGDFYTSGSDPVGEDGNKNTNANRNSQYDFVISGVDLETFKKPIVITNPNNENDIFKSYNHGLVFDSRNFTQTELDTYFSPVKEDDSGENSMQHMGIIKQFNSCD